MHPQNRRRPARIRSALAAGLGLLLAGIATVPAQADSIREDQWHLDAMHAEEMWKTSTGKGIAVAVIDSGVDKSVPELRGQLLEGKDFSGMKGDWYTDYDDHGTGMASLIAGTGVRGNGVGVHGLAPGAKILPIRTRYAQQDFGGTGVFIRHVAQSIRFAADSDAKIINLSLGKTNSPGKNDAGTPELAEAVRYALDQGKLVFASAGNRGQKGNTVSYPAATPGVVAVAAVDKNAKPIAMSQWGPQVDLAAPGADIASACAGGTHFCRGSGTSNASALASASAALIWSKHPDWTNNQVLRVLMQTASGNEKGLSRDDVVGYGVIRPRIALTNPGDPGPANEYPIPEPKPTASKSPSPKPSTPPSADADADAETKDPSARQEATAPTTTDDSNTGLWLALGIGAAVLLGTAIAVPTAIRNRRQG
ncbi:type VII secretion-associated serine protease mycosin [Streptomyces apocyni]|uniref:type VII secretion-associated serine protease mycosin n=1 Tax=Streptomyces apocyni TaxID=2654677 RepID=UPI0012E9FF4E|nr:type VII secretion-associated serine protease mycosin [Streptomyces apocyni]